jgi:CO/xanthine dehydrogenase FAD-binding subunit
MDLMVQTLIRPRSLAEALDALATRSNARVIAGGTDLVVMLRDGRRRAECLIDLCQVPLAGITVQPGETEIGAGSTMDAIASHPVIRERHPALAAAAGQVGAWTIQCRATLGGNLANASPAADTAPVLLVADARVRLASARGEREVGVNELFLGPGKTVLAADELIVSVVVPYPKPPAGGRVVERFVKVGPRREQIISMVSLAGRAVVEADGCMVEVRLALGAVAPTPTRARAVETALRGRRLDEALVRESARLVQADITPIDDVRATARYRRLAAAVLVERFLQEVANG